MGQQQLLLLVLASIIVGFATLTAIQAAEENQRRATLSALQNRALSIGSELKEAADQNRINNEKTARATAGFKEGKIPAPGAGNSASCTASVQFKGEGPPYGEGKGKGPPKNINDEIVEVTCSENSGGEKSQSVSVKVSNQKGARVISINGSKN